MKKCQRFIAKELKQILANKKAFLICFLFMFYTPFLNVNAQNNILPFDFIVPILFIIAGSYPSEYSYSIMNTEFENKTYDIIFLSNTNPILIILSKALLPTILGIIICFSSIFLNDIISIYFKSGIYAQFLSLELTVFIILSIVFSNVLTIWLSNFFKKIVNKEMYTLTIFIELTIVVSLFYLLYEGNGILSICVLLIFITGLVLHNYILLKHYYFKPLLSNKKKSFISKQQSFILIQNGYVHVWDMKKSCLLLAFTILASSYVLLYNNAYEIVTIYKFLPIILCSFVVNSIIYKSYVIDVKSDVKESYYICKCNKNFILFSKIIYAVLLNGLCILIFTIILNEYFVISEVITYILLDVLLSISMIGMSTYTIVKFSKQIGLLLAIINMLMCLILYINRVNNLIILMFILLSYALSYKFFFSAKSFNKKSSMKS